MITIFSKPMCSACEKLKEYLIEQDIEFEEMDGSTAEGKTEMAIRNVFIGEFPAMLVGSRLYTYLHLFENDGRVKDLYALFEPTRRP